ncbi:MAG: hypothetical protein WBE34_05680 [Candidatus Nitrosopolaris sp.]
MLVTDRSLERTRNRKRISVCVNTSFNPGRFLSAMLDELAIYELQTNHPKYTIPADEM